MNGLKRAISLVERGDEEALPAGPFLVLDHAGARPKGGGLQFHAWFRFAAHAGDAAIDGGVDPVRGALRHR